MTLTNHIIVDASIARSISDPARHPVSMACLTLVRTLETSNCATGAAVTPALLAEWKRHAPRVMTSWLVSMESRGRLRRESDRRVNDLRRAVDAVHDEGVRAALTKDLHLSEAAVLHHLPVASRDDKQRRFLADLAPSYGAAGRIQWLDPTVTPDGWQEWLTQGCTDPSAYAVAT